MTVYAADIETTGLLDMMAEQDDPKLHNICGIEINSPKMVLLEGHQESAIQHFLDEGHTFLMHSGITFDMEALKFLGYDVSKVTCIDTLALSYYLEPKRKRHGLASYGEEFGVPKPEIENWEDQTQEEYNHRVIEDCRIQKLLWQKQKRQLVALYGKDFMPIVNYLMFKQKQQRMQQEIRWKIDVDLAQNLFNELEVDVEAKIEGLRQSMPDVAVRVVKERPKLPYKKDGTLSATGITWRAFCEKAGQRFEDPKPIPYIKGY